MSAVQLPIPLRATSCFANNLVFEFVEFMQSELFAMNGFGKEARVVSLLAAEAQAAHFGFGEL